MSSSKFSKPTYWVGLSMVTLPTLLFVAGLVFLAGSEVVGLGLVMLVALALCAVFFAKGFELMMDAEYNSED